MSFYDVREEKVRFYCDGCDDQANGEHIVDLADAASFKSVEFPSLFFLCYKDYGRDKRFAFYRGKVIDGADPETFTSITHNYARDKNWVYGRGRRISSRVESFAFLNDQNRYATDGVNNFFEDVIIEEPGFEFLPGRDGYARTKTRIFHYGKVVPGADAATFEIYPNAYSVSRDKNHVYFKDLPVAGADPASFEQIGPNLFRDRRAVYSDGSEIRGADPKTARLSRQGAYVIDNKHVFYRGKKIDADTASFEDLDWFWSRDKFYVYRYGKKVPIADSPSFRVVSSDVAEDKDYRYRILPAGWEEPETIALSTDFQDSSFAG